MSDRSRTQPELGWRQRALALAFCGLAFWGLAFWGLILTGITAPPAAAQTAIPAPALDPAPGAGGDAQTVVLAGGCFWGVQAVFQHLNGVTRAVSGYAGGGADTAQYETVSTGQTGHAESVQVTFDPKQVSLGTILRVFFAVAHDPTQRDGQGADQGTQYRSAIFTRDDAQRRIAAAYIAQLDLAGVFDRPIATRLEPLNGFYPAEAYHQDFATLHPNHPYILFTDQPKVDALKRLFPDRFRASPVLVNAQASPVHN